MKDECTAACSMLLLLPVLCCCCCCLFRAAAAFYCYMDDECFVVLLLLPLLLLPLLLHAAAVAATAVAVSVAAATVAATATACYCCYCYCCCYCYHYRCCLPLPAVDAAAAFNCYLLLQFCTSCKAMSWLLPTPICSGSAAAVPAARHSGGARGRREFNYNGSPVLGQAMRTPVWPGSGTACECASMKPRGGTMP